MTGNNVALTTYNNPYDPFTNWDSWYQFDVQNGTDCCGYLSRIIDSIRTKYPKINNTNDAFVDDETNDEMIEEAMTRIVNQEPFIYLVVHPDDKRYKLSLKEFEKTIPKQYTSVTDETKE